MGGAYTAQPASSSSTSLPDGWPSHWPFPGPNPPGHEPVYGISFVSPPTPDDVGIGEEITIRVKMYEEGAGAPPPPQLSTIAPNVNIDWIASIEGFPIDTDSTGWTYISGSYYSSWTFTPSLLPVDITEPPTLLTIDASGIMNNGSASQAVDASDTIEIVEKVSFIVEATIDSYGVSGSPVSWYTGVSVALGISIDSVSVGYWSRTWRVDDGNGTFHEHTASNSGTLPDGIVWTQDIPNRKLTLTIPKDSFDPTHEYYILTSSDSFQSLGSLTINTSTRVQLNGADDVLLSEMNASGSGSVPPNSSFVETIRYDSGQVELLLGSVFGLWSVAVITNY